MKTLNRLALARPMVLCGVLLFFYSAFRAPHSAFGQTLTTVSDTLRNADGTLASGKLRIYWGNFAFTESGTTYAIGAGNKEITVTAGVVSVQLYPTANSIPSGITYRVEYDLTSGSAIEYWSIPTTGPATIGSVRTPVGVSPTPAGTVTSVALTVPAEFTVAGSPITVNGTLAVTKATQSANLVFAGPASGGAAAPGFRAAVDADIPGTLISKIFAGISTIGDGAGNDNLSFFEEATNPACAVGDFRVWANSADLKLKKCENGTISDLGGGGYYTIQEEGTALTQRNTLNFIGPAVTAVDSPSPARTNVTVVASGIGACAANTFASALNDGAAPTCAQPSFSNLSGAATKAQLPAAVAYEDEANIFTVAGGVTLDNQLGLRLREATVNGTEFIEHRATAAITTSSTYTWPVAALGFLRSSAVGDLSLAAASGTGACPANQFQTGDNDNAAPTCAQPGFSNLSGAATLAQLPFGTANQLLKTNAGATAQEHATLATGTAGTDFAVAFGVGAITLNLPTASAANTGKLSSADWTTFNNSVDSVSGTAGEIASSGGQTPVISLPATLSTAKTISGGWTFNTAATLFQGSAAALRVDLENPDAPAEDSFADSPELQITGIRDSLAGAGVTREEINWKTFADVSAVGGTSALVFQSRIGAAAFANRLTVSDASVVTATTFIGALTGNASTASALAANGANCTGNNFALGVDAAGVAECAQPAFSNLSGTFSDAQVPATLDLNNNVLQGASPLTLEGLTVDGFDTTIAVTDPTASRIFTIPNADSVAIQPLTCGGTDKVSAVSAAGVITCTADAGGAGGDSISVNGVAATDADFDDATPAAPANSVNVKWQKDALTPNNLSANLLLTDVDGSGIGVSGAELITASGETNFLAAGALTCGAGTPGRLQVHTTPLQYCDNAATPALQYAAYGDSTGKANIALDLQAASEVVSDAEVVNTITLDNLTQITTRAISDTTGTLLEGRGGTGESTYTLGDTLYSDAANTLAKLAGNITTTKQFLSQTGTGAVSAAPVWAQPAFADLSGAATDAQVPNTITLDNLTQITTRAIADTTGTLLVGRGGSGATTLTGLLQGNGTAAFTAITDSSVVGQTLRVTGASAYGWGALDLADPDAVTGLLPDGNIAATITRDTEWPSATATLTNKTLDAEATGNVITQPKKLWIPAATCVAATATNNWDDDPAVAEPTAACVAGTNITKGVADFLDTATNAFQTHIALTSDFTGNIDLRFVWLTSVTANNVVWQAQTICVATGGAETDDPAFNAASTVTDAAAGTANAPNEATITSLTITGCAAGELLHLRVLRDPAHASDTLAATARLYGVEVTLRRAM